MVDTTPCMKHDDGWIDTAVETYGVGEFDVTVKERGTNDEVLYGEFEVRLFNSVLANVSAQFAGGNAYWRVFYRGLGRERGTGRYETFADIICDDLFIDEAERAKCGTTKAMDAIARIAAHFSWAR